MRAGSGKVRTISCLVMYGTRCAFIRLTLKVQHHLHTYPTLLCKLSRLNSTTMTRQAYASRPILHCKGVWNMSFVFCTYHTAHLNSLLASHHLCLLLNTNTNACCIPASQVQLSSTHPTNAAAHLAQKSRQVGQQH